MKNIFHLALVGLLLAAAPAFGQVAISGLPSATTPPSGSEVFPVVQGGVTKKMPIGSMPNSGVTAGSYGDASHCSAFTVAASGLLTSASQSTSCPGGGGGGGTPGGSTTQLQYNNSGAFGGVSGATSNGTTVTLTSPTFVTPALGTIASGNLAAGTGYTVGNVSGLGSGVATALAIAHDASGGVCTVGGSGCPGGGSVTSVATGACLTGGPITTTGTLAGTYSVNPQTGTSYVINASDGCKLVTFSNGSSIAVTLPQATGSFGAGYSFDVQNKGVGTATITPTTSTINGSASLAVAQNRGCTVVSDGVNYQVSACTALLP